MVDITVQTFFIAVLRFPMHCYKEAKLVHTFNIQHSIHQHISIATVSMIVLGACYHLSELLTWQQTLLLVVLY